MSDLKSQLIKLGSTNPELRPHIREILAYGRVSGDSSLFFFIDDWLSQVMGEMNSFLSHYTNIYYGIMDDDVIHPVNLSDFDGGNKIELTINLRVGKDLTQAAVLVEASIWSLSFDGESTGESFDKDVSFRIPLTRNNKDTPKKMGEEIAKHLSKHLNKA